MFCKIDIRLRYYQLKIRAEHLPRRNFRTRYGNYELLVMSFGLSNVHAAFMSLMDDVSNVYWIHLLLSLLRTFWGNLRVKWSI